MQEIAALEEKKKSAIAGKDYEAATQLKTQIVARNKLVQQVYAVHLAEQTHDEIALLHEQKKLAARAGNFKEAELIKIEIQTLEQHQHRQEIAALEEGMKSAATVDDYATAGQLKEQINQKTRAYQLRQARRHGGW